MSVGGGGKHGLLLVRTPLQAWVAERALAAEGLGSFDLLYFTHNNSEEDRHYFGRLAQDARNARYCWAPARRFDVLSHLDFYRQTLPWKRRSTYDQVMLASINSPVINALATHHGLSELVTFDDGLANIVPDGIYQNANDSLRARLYRRALGAVPIETLKQRICRHYSIYPEFDNIVEATKVRKLAGWRRAVAGTRADAELVTYFVGQPFEEALSTAQIEQLQAKLTSMQISFYVRHPRERQILHIGASPIEKDGRIAEDAILRHANGRRVHVIGWFSSVLFNLAAAVDQCTALLNAASPETPQRRAMALKAGCFVDYV